MEHEHHKPASFFDSPQEAMRAPQEEFLYLACLHEGTGVEAPVSSKSQRKTTPPLPLPSASSSKAGYFPAPGALT